MTGELDYLFTPKGDPRTLCSIVTGSWAHQPRHARVPQIDEDAVYVSASICNPVESIQSALLPFQELY